MKKLLTLLAVLLLLPSCYKEPIPDVILIEKDVAEILQVINGHFISQRDVLGSIEYEDITFTRLEKPREIVSLFGTFIAYGTAKISKYYNDHALEINKDCYFTIEGWSSEITFYRYRDNDIVDKGESRVYIPISRIAFKMHHKGEVSENAKLYKKL
jgi:hypothetical protein